MLRIGSVALGNFFNAYCGQDSLSADQGAYISL